MAAKLGTGFTRLPNALLMTLVQGDLPRAQIKILLLLARMTISFQRATVPLSKSVIERFTGLQGKAVLEALSGIESARLIRRIPGSPSRPSELGLVFDAERARMGSSSASWGANRSWESVGTQVAVRTEDSEGTQDGAGSQVAGETQDADVTLDAVGSQDPDESQDGAGTQVPPPSQDRVGTLLPHQTSVLLAPDKKNRERDALSVLSSKLRDYFASLKPVGKQEGEWRDFERLRRDFSDEDISAGLCYLRAHAIPGKGEPCHSPMAYLSKAMLQVQAAVAQERDREQIRARVAAAAVARGHAEANEASESQREWQKMLQAFLAKYPDAERQATAITEIVGRLKLPLNPHGDPARRIAVSFWWENANKEETHV